MPYLRRHRLRSTSRSTRSYRRYSRYRRYARYPRLTRPVRYSNGRDSSSINLKVVTNAYFSGNMEAGKNDSNVFCLSSLGDTISTSANYVGPITALNSALFRAYCSLYGELKLRGVLYEISVVNPIGVGGSTVPSFMIFASVDRRYFNLNRSPTSVQLSNYASISPSTYVMYNRTKFKKYIGARDLIEKSQYLDTDILYSSLSGWGLRAITSAAGNVNFFNPAMYFFVRFPFTLTTPFVIHISVRATYYFTFRNPIPFDTVPAPSAAASASIAGETMEAIEPPVATSEFLDDDTHLLAEHTSPPLVS